MNPLKKLTTAETIGLAGTIHEKRIHSPSTESLKNAFAASTVDFPREYDAHVCPMHNANMPYETNSNVAVVGHLA